MLHITHLWASLIFPMEVVLSPIEWEMDVARVVPPQSKVELDAIRFAQVCFWWTNGILTLDFKGDDASFCAICFIATRIEVEVLYGKLILSFMDMLIGSMPILIVLVKIIFPVKVEFCI